MSRAGERSPETPSECHTQRSRRSGPFPSPAIARKDGDAGKYDGCAPRQRRKPTIDELQTTFCCPGRQSPDTLDAAERACSLVISFVNLLTEAIDSHHRDERQRERFGIGDSRISFAVVRRAAERLGFRWKRVSLEIRRQSISLQTLDRQFLGPLWSLSSA